LLAFAGSCLAFEDTPANRSSEAERYLDAFPASEMFSDVAGNMAKAIPAEKRRAFLDAMKENLDTDALSDVMKEALVKSLTSEELRSLADLYSSPTGKSAMRKMNLCMADLAPVIQAEIRKAMEKAGEAAPATH
jgi:hypothetical protein